MKIYNHEDLKKAAEEFLRGLKIGEGVRELSVPEELSDVYLKGVHDGVMDFINWALPTDKDAD